MYQLKSLIFVALLALLFTGCSSDDDKTVPIKESSNTPEKSITITIGNITDLTGPGANGMELVNLALEDVIRYYNENDYIPGVKLEVIHWDSQMDPSRTIPGYEWLLQQGADLITTCAPGVAVVLKPIATAEQVVLFTQSGEMDAIEPPDYVFCIGSMPQYEAYTLLSWIAENDWDYQRNGPAKIGAAAWMEPYAIGFVQAMEEYAEVHPNQFEFVDGYLTNFTFDWTNEVESLKKCDYIFPPMIMHGFTKAIRNTGSDARFIGGAPHTAFFNQVSDADAWPAIDGMLIVYTGGWWHEDDKLMIITEEILNRYHPDSVEEIISRGSGYGAAGPYLMICDIIAKTVEKTGPEGFNSTTFYNTAQTWSYPLAHADYSYGPTKRYMINDLCFLEASAQEQDLVRIDPNYYPILTEP